MEGQIVELGSVDGIDIDSSCIKFLEPIAPEGPELKRFESLFNNNFSELTELSISYQRVSELEYAMPTSVKVTNNSKSIIRFLLDQMQDAKNKADTIKEKFYARKVTILSKVSFFLLESKNNNIPILFDSKGYAKLTEKEFSENKELNIEKRHFQSLESYLKNESLKLETRFSLEKMREALSNAAEKVDQNREYSPVNEFDDEFTDFVVWSKTDQRFDLTVKRVVENSGKRLINIRDLDHITKSFNMLFQPKNINEKIVINFAITRYFFDALSIVPGFFLYSNDESPVFTEKCASLRKKTPTQLGIHPSLMKPEMMEVPFEDIVKDSKYLNESSQYLNSLHFYTNPFDIAFTAFNAVKAIDNFVLGNKQIDESSPEGSSMSFDDVFSLFCPVLAIDPPKNCMSLAKFYSKIDGLVFSSALDFAKLLILSSVDYITNIEL